MAAFSKKVCTIKHSIFLDNVQVSKNHTRWWIFYDKHKPHWQAAAARGSIKNR